MDSLFERLQALVPTEGSDGFTSADVVELMGVSEQLARRMIRQLIAAGQAEPARLKRRNMGGILQTIVGYRIVSPPG